MDKDACSRQLLHREKTPSVRGWFKRNAAYASFLTRIFSDLVDDALSLCTERALESVNNDFPSWWLREQSRAEPTAASFRVEKKAEGGR